jgi:phage repressor protein C with HTH and peptisase S24 domain
MADNDPRAVLERLIEERREDYAALSRLIGRNSAYIQQFIKRGTPRKLAENDRRTLAEYFSVDEHLLGGPVSSRPLSPEALIPIARYSVAASAGPGAIAGFERPVAQLGFSKGWLEQLSRAKPEDLSIIKVEGDSMFPTLNDGDDIMVDRSSASRQVSDGIYVLRRDDTLMVKRITVNPSRGDYNVSSDNPAYASWSDCAPGDIDVLGRVVWAGRRIR